MSIKSAINRLCAMISGKVYRRRCYRDRRSIIRSRITMIDSFPPGAVLFPPFPSARRAGWTLHLLAHDYRSPARQLAAKRVNTIEMLLAREAGNNEDVVGRTMGVDALLSNRFPDFPIPICDSRFLAPLPCLSRPGCSSRRSCDADASRWTAGPPVLLLPLLSPLR